MGGGSMAGKESVKQVREQLPDVGIGLTYVEVHQRVGCWSIGTIKHALRMLREEGVAERIGTHNVPRFRLAKTGKAEL